MTNISENCVKCLAALQSPESSYARINVTLRILSVNSWVIVLLHKRECQLNHIWRNCGHFLDLDTARVTAFSRDTQLLSKLYSTNGRVTLYKLTKKGALWLWGSDCEKTYELLRGKLIKEPVVLAFPEWKTPFYVETDASAGGVAAVLYQRDTKTGKPRPKS